MKDIKGYEGLYAVTSCGKVWSYYSQRFLKPCSNNDYLQVVLCKDGIKKHHYVHRLIAEAYIPNPTNKPQVNHKNECKTDNYINNLEWATNQENVNYGTRTMRQAKAVSKAVYCVELNRTFGSMKDAAEELSVDRRGISDCCRGKLKTTGGYHWRYAE